MSARDVIADALMNEGCGDSDQCDRTADRVIAALRAAGYAVVPVEATPHMARDKPIVQSVPNRKPVSYHDPNCRRCHGTGKYLTQRDMHRSEGWVPCYCKPPAILTRAKEAGL